jgi:hypothetical protein
MISKNMVKSKASSVHPSHAATQANHCSLVGSFHHATDEPERSAAVVMAFPPRVSQGSQVRILWRERPADGNARCAVFREDFGKSSQAALPRSYIGRLSGATPGNRR